jgi:hypothetical protein
MPVEILDWSPPNAEEPDTDLPGRPAVPEGYRWHLLRLKRSDEFAGAFVAVAVAVGDADNYSDTRPEVTNRRHGILAVGAANRATEAADRAAVEAAGRKFLAEQQGYAGLRRQLAARRADLAAAEAAVAKSQAAATHASYDGTGDNAIKAEQELAAAVVRRDALARRVKVAEEAVAREHPRLTDGLVAAFVRESRRHKAQAAADRKTWVTDLQEEINRCLPAIDAAEQRRQHAERLPNEFRAMAKKLLAEG